MKFTKGIESLIADQAARLKVTGDTPEEMALIIDRNELFKESALTLSNYIKGLDLSTEQNDKLIELMLDHVLKAERSAAIGGIIWACENLFDGDSTDPDNTTSANALHFVQ